MKFQLLSYSELISWQQWSGLAAVVFLEDILIMPPLFLLWKCFEVFFLSHLWPGDYRELKEQTSDYSSKLTDGGVKSVTLLHLHDPSLQNWTRTGVRVSLSALKSGGAAPSLSWWKGGRIRTKETGVELLLVLMMKWTYIHEHSSCQQVFKYFLLARFSLFLNLALQPRYPSAGSNQTDNWRQPSSTALPGPSV